MATFQTKLMNMAESISNKLSYFNALDHLRHVSNQTIVMLEKIFVRAFADKLYICHFGVQSNLCYDASYEAVTPFWAVRCYWSPEFVFP